jgi:GrpB-like predicted nucleotidyltransferase (UPF0157 family)
VKVELVPYSPRWPDDFAELERMLRDALGELALRIDHIGSTSIPGMQAKDVIDVQVTVASLGARDEITKRFDGIGFVARPYFGDHVPPGGSEDEAEWSKLVFAPPDRMRVCNVHVRERGRANQRYALLFRDFLRADRDAVAAWIGMKQRLAEQYPDDSMTYGYVKDAATDVLLLAAERWASDTGWIPA